MTTSRIVVDTNVLLSAMLSKQGKPRRVIEAVVSDGRLLFSEQTFFEITSRLKRPRFNKWVSKEERTAFLEALVPFADWVTISGDLQICRDPNDDIFLETAQVGRADVIITGDKDLLVLHPFEGIPILRPAEWLELRQAE